LELREQRRVDARARLVAGPQPVAERLDDVVGGHAYVAGAGVDHAEHRIEHAAHRTHFAAIGIARRRHRVIVAEQLVGAVDEVDVHAVIIAYS
jgi:hypothetical protein